MKTPLIKIIFVCAIVGLAVGSVYSAIFAGNVLLAHKRIPLVYVASLIGLVIMTMRASQKTVAN